MCGFGPAVSAGFLAILGSVAVAPEANAAAAAGQVRVTLQNDAAPADVVARAQAEVVRLFALIRVEVLWVAEHAASPQGSHLVKITNWEPDDPNVSITALGVTYGERWTTRRAYVMWPRVRHQAVRNAMGLDAMLAVAIAHEMGHMLSPKKSHSKRGLMRESWDANDLRMAAAGLLYFSQDSAVMIAQGLRSGAAVAGSRTGTTR